MNILKKYIIQLISNVKMKFFLIAICYKSVTNMSQNNDRILDLSQICDGILIPSQFYDENTIPSQFCDQFVTDSYLKKLFFIF